MTSRFRNIIKYCKECGDQLVLRCTRDIERKNFCSRNCSSKWNIDHDRTGMRGKKLTLEQRQKLSKIRIENGLAKGENNPRYIDGRSIFRNTVLKSKTYVCSMCGKDKNYLIAHHIEPCNRTNDRGRCPLDGDHTENNGTFMCASCHKKHHNHLKGLQNVTKTA